MTHKLWLIKVVERTKPKQLCTNIFALFGIFKQKCSESSVFGLFTFNGLFGFSSLFVIFFLIFCCSQSIIDSKSKRLWVGVRCLLLVSSNSYLLCYSCQKLRFQFFFGFLGSNVRYGCTVYACTLSDNIRDL